MSVSPSNGAVGSQNAEPDDVKEKKFLDQSRGDSSGRNGAGKENRQRKNNQPRRDKRDVHGWIVLDKPLGMTSTHAVAVVKRLFQAKRAGHAGTLDPLASG